ESIRVALGTIKTVNFNGAVDHRRRKGRIAEVVALRQRALQWGRRSSSTESGAEFLADVQHQPASMGPSIIVDGEKRSSWWRRDEGGHFNGAGDHCRWRGPEGRAVRRDRRRASMGPSIIVDGECISLLAVVAARTSFNGAVDHRRRREEGARQV